MHLGNGDIKDHFQQAHDMTLIRNIIFNCTNITRRESDIIHYLCEIFCVITSERNERSFY